MGVRAVHVRIAQADHDRDVADGLVAVGGVCAERHAVLAVLGVAVGLGEQHRVMPACAVELAADFREFPQLHPALQAFRACPTHVVQVLDDGERHAPRPFCGEPHAEFMLVQIGRVVDLDGQAVQEAFGPREAVPDGFGGPLALRAQQSAQGSVGLQGQAGDVMHHAFPDLVRAGVCDHVVIHAVALAGDAKGRVNGNRGLAVPAAGHDEQRFPVAVRDGQAAPAQAGVDGGMQSDDAAGSVGQFLVVGDDALDLADVLVVAAACRDLAEPLCGPGSRLGCCERVFPLQLAQRLPERRLNIRTLPLLAQDGQARADVLDLPGLRESVQVALVGRKDAPQGGVPEHAPGVQKVHDLLGGGAGTLAAPVVGLHVPHQHRKARHAGLVQFQGGRDDGVENLIGGVHSRAVQSRSSGVVLGVTTGGRTSSFLATP